jgi:hypothetical protein
VEAPNGQPWPIHEHDGPPGGSYRVFICLDELAILSQRAPKNNSLREKRKKLDYPNGDQPSRKPSESLVYLQFFARLAVGAICIGLDRGRLATDSTSLVAIRCFLVGCGFTAFFYGC